MTESSLPSILSILPVRASAEGQVTSTTQLHCLLIRGVLRLSCAAGVSFDAEGCNSEFFEKMRV